MNRAPRWITIIVTLVLVGIGALGTFAEVLPERVGVWAFVAASGLMVLGILLPGL